MFGKVKVLTKWHFFLGGCALRIFYFFDVTIQCHEIIEKSVVYYCWFDCTSLRYESHMFGKNHSCFGKITHVWNLPINKTSSKWLDKSTHVWEKPLSISILMKWEKPNMCGFYQTLTKYKGVCKMTHMFE